MGKDRTGGVYGWAGNSSNYSSLHFKSSFLPLTMVRGGWAHPVGTDPVITRLNFRVTILRKLRTYWHSLLKVVEE